MKRLMIVLSAGSLVGCSSSTMSMLEAGDPKACAAADVLADVSSIVKQRAEGPGDDKSLVKNYDELERQAIESITVEIKKIRPLFVNKETQEIACTGTAQLTSERLSDKEERELEYRIQPDLIQKKAVVSANILQVQAAIVGMVKDILTPEFEVAQKGKDEEDEKRANEEMQTYFAEKPGEIQALKKEARKEVVPSMFSDEELRIIDATYFAHEVCMSSSGTIRELFCRQQERLIKRAEKLNLCSTAGNEWFHCSNEQELGQQRQAVYERKVQELRQKGMDDQGRPLMSAPE